MSAFVTTSRHRTGFFALLWICPALVSLTLSGCMESKTPNGDSAEFDTLSWDLGAASCERDVRCDFMDAADLDECTATLNVQFARELEAAEDGGLARDASCDAILVDATREASCEATTDELSCALVPCRVVHGDKPLGAACGPTVDDCAQALLCDPEDRVCVDPCDIPVDATEE